MKRNLYVIFLSISISTVLWVSISLTNDYSASLQLPIRFLNIPEGYVTTLASTQKVNVKVRGRGWNLLSAMMLSKNDYYVDLGNELNKNQIIDLITFASENTWLTTKLQILEINPDSLKFSFEKLGFIKVKIVPHLKLEFKPGYGLASDVGVLPESSMVSGPVTKIKDMTQISTELLELSNVSEKAEHSIDIENLPELYSEVQKVTLTLDIQQIVEQNFNDIGIKILDTPIDRDVVLFPNKINVSLRGGIDVLGRLDKNKISASVYYRDIVLDTTGTIIPKVLIPGHTELVFLKPGKLKYVIKKFNK